MKCGNQLGNTWLDSVSSSVSGESLSQTLELELIGLADRLNLGHERKRASKDFDLSKWKEGELP